MKTPARKLIRESIIANLIGCALTRPFTRLSIDRSAVRLETSVLSEYGSPFSISCFDEISIDLSLRDYTCYAALALGQAGV